MRFFWNKETPPQDCLQANATNQTQEGLSEGTLIEPHALFCDRAACTVVFDTSANKRFGTCSYGLGNDDKPETQTPEPTSIAPIALGAFVTGLENYSVE